MFVARSSHTAQYRGLGIGTALMAHAKSLDRPLEAHVQKGDADLVAWYTAQGFRVREEVPGYFPRLADSTALLMEHGWK